MATPPGPKELALRAMREDKASKKKPTTIDLRKKISKIKPMSKRGGGRGR